MRTGYMRYSYWTCIYDTPYYIHVDTKNLMLVNVIERYLSFAVIGNPCNNPNQLLVPFVQLFDWRVTNITNLAREVHCIKDRMLKGMAL